MATSRKTFLCAIDEPVAITDEGLGSPDPESDNYNDQYEDELAQRYAEELSHMLCDGVPLNVEMYEKGCPKKKNGLPYVRHYIYGESA